MEWIFHFLLDNSSRIELLYFLVSDMSSPESTDLPVGMVQLKKKGHSQPTKETEQKHQPQSEPQSKPQTSPSKPIPKLVLTKQNLSLDLNLNHKEPLPPEKPPRPPAPQPSKLSDVPGYSAVPMAGLPLVGAVCGLCLGGPVVSL